MPTLAVTRSGRVPWLNSGVFEHLADPLGDGQRVVQRGLAQQHGERVAAVAGDHVAAADQMLDLARRLAQDDVAALVAVVGVDVRKIRRGRQASSVHIGARLVACSAARASSASRARRFGSEVSRSVCVRIACMCIVSACVAMRSSVAAMRRCTSSVASRICATALATLAGRFFGVLFQARR